MESSGAGGRAVRSADVGAVHWLLAGLVLLTAGIHAFIGVRTGRSEFVVAAVVFLAGVLVLFTRFFRPVLYLLGAAYVVVLTVIWVLAGTPFFALGLLDKAVQLVLFGLFVYLFFVEAPADGG